MTLNIEFNSQPFHDLTYKTYHQGTFLINNVNADISHHFFSRAVASFYSRLVICFFPEMQDFYLVTKPPKITTVTETAEDMGMYILLETRDHQ